MSPAKSAPCINTISVSQTSAVSPGLDTSTKRLSACSVGGEGNQDIVYKASVTYQDIVYKASLTYQDIVYKASLTYQDIVFKASVTYSHINSLTCMCGHAHIRARAHTPVQTHTQHVCTIVVTFVQKMQKVRPVRHL
jgi:hypothetical protein